MAELIYSAGTIPELEVFDSGDIALGKHLMAEGVLKGPCLFQVCMGIRWGFDWNPETLNYARSILPPGSPWAAFAIGRMEFPMLAQAWLLGGHVRVGLEDNIYLNKGELATSNTVLVERAVRILREFGAEPMTAAEARDGALAGRRVGAMSRGVLVVTGAGRGIGAAIARAAAVDGWTVAVNYARDADSAGATVAAIEAAGGKARAIQADVQSEAGVVALFEAADALGPLRGLVNNAGGSAEARIADITAADYDRMMDGNLRTTVFCSREAVRRMATDRGGQGGVILNVGSRASVLGGQPGRVMYAAAKGAVDGFTVGLANEVGKLGIRVLGMRPGVIRTESQEARVGAERLRQLTAAIALGRPGEPEEVASLAAFLLSPAAAYMTGTMVDISGGR
jgi:NAD(P)-dependent dehydrogenase (short-subunit alcohol dehydrogenase family)